MANSFTSTTATAESSDTYSTRANDEQAYGADNLAIYADLNDNQDASEITDRINYAHQVVYKIINARLAAAELDAPATEDNFSQFDLLAYVESEMVGAWLYRTRGKNDVDDNVAGKMQARWDDALALLELAITTVDAEDGESQQAGSFQFIAIDRGTTCDDEDEYAS